MEWSADLQNLWVVALAGGLGAIIGLEREISGKPAGLRTHIFVCAGSALLIVLSYAILDNFEKKGSELINADPIRVIQAIVIGISFLGAGTIVHHGGDRVDGLTTAASIFLTAGLGVAVAVGHNTLALGTTALAIIVLAVVGWVERWIERRLGRDRKQDVPQEPSRQSNNGMTQRSSIS